MLLPYTSASASPNPPLPSRTIILSPRSARTPRSQRRFKSSSHWVCSSLFATCCSLDLASAIRPKAQCDQNHHVLSATLMALALALVLLDCFFLTLDCDPNAITLNNCWCFWKMIFLHTTHEWFDLIDQLIDRAQPNRTSQLSTPALFNRS